MEKKVITVSREFGSGGRSIAKELAQRLGWSYYDKELVKEVAAKTGFDPAFIEDRGEFAATRSILSYALSGQGTPGVMRGMSASDFLWCMQRDVILELAEKGNCVIVGRCADYILRDNKDCLHVFIHADMASRAKRIVERYGEKDKSPEKRLAEKDQKRRVYYKNYTGRNWGQAQNYDLCLNSGVLGEEACVELIVAACK